MGFLNPAPVPKSNLIVTFLIATGCEPKVSEKSRTFDEYWEPLRQEVQKIGKPKWRPMLSYLVDLHQRSTHPAQDPFPYPWEELGPGYPALTFGHWDIVHTILDVLPTVPDHARHQILNNLANQSEQGFLPGSIYLDSPRLHIENKITWNKHSGHPPLWPVAVQDFVSKFDGDLISNCYEPLVKQIDWYEKNRKAQPNGFYYEIDSWESGLDDDFRQAYGLNERGAWAFLDATSHVFQLYDLAAKWAEQLGYLDDVVKYKNQADKLKKFIQNKLWDGKDGFFYDFWCIEDPSTRVGSFVGMWPLVVGAATPQQAQRVIDEHLLNPKRFFTKHPISTISIDGRFQLLTWRGPAWNSMSYWAARGCLRYDRGDAALKIVESALDASAAQFERTGTIWEFYHPFGGRPEDLKREVTPPHLMPNKDYVGHNPLFAMARIYDELR